MSHRFIFAGCKFGYEQHCKSELLEACPQLRFSFSRPGFQTFKLTEGTVDFSLINRLTFVRTAGWYLGRCSTSDLREQESVRADLRQQLVDQDIHQIHYWNRNLGSPDDVDRLDFMRGELSETGQLVRELAQQLHRPFNQPGRANQNVLSLIEVDPGMVWYGVHRVESPQQSWPGGLIRFEIPESPVSRAYFKTREAILWSRFPLQPQQLCIEIGCAPGGSVQALLESGLQVIGIDPADVDPRIAENPNFQHLKKRSAEVRKKSLAGAKWLLADSNVAPQYTLDAVADIAGHRLVNLQGLLLTLKFLQPDLADQLEACRQRVREMGFQYVRTRQLAFNRNEVCLAALKRKSILRFGKLRS